MPVKMRWLGTAGVELNHDGQILLVDPYLSRPGRREVFFKPLIPKRDIILRYLAGVEDKIRAIIVAHTHFDHALDIPELARNLDVPVFGSSSLDTLLSISGLPGRVTKCRPHERISLDGAMTLTMIPSAHGLILSRLLLMEGEIDSAWKPPLRTRQYRLGAMFAPKIEMDGLTFLHVGSAGFLERELETHRCDVLFLCVAQWKKWPAYPERIIEITRPSCVIPIHYDDFSLPLMPGGKCRVMQSADLEGFCHRIRMCGKGIDVLCVDPFKTETL
ncbi:MAG: MBL fold metallo-hydrolase [Syntrophales bacterium]|nr:MBL fold metallo-hydrolase [Syntrophales bacterium]